MNLIKELMMIALFVTILWNGIAEVVKHKASLPVKPLVLYPFHGKPIQCFNVNKHCTMENISLTKYLENNKNERLNNGLLHDK